MYTTFWFEFFILFLAAIFGSLAILPYSLRLLKDSPKRKQLKLPLWILLLLSVLQNAIIFAIFISIGLLAIHQLGHHLPLLEAISMGKWSKELLVALLSPALMWGLITGLILFVGDLFFIPYFPQKLLKTALTTTQWENFTASFYGGINEELSMRLFGVSVTTWVLSSIWHQPISIIFWCANVFMAIIFALGHVPALKTLVGNISSVMLFRTLILNIPVGLVCGWIFWNYGIGAAILTHFTADIVYHVGGTYILRWKFKNK